MEVIEKGVFSRTTQLPFAADQLKPSAGRGVSCTVDCISLDDWFTNFSQSESVDLLKIDVEGAELDILKGATNFIARFRPDLVIEVHPSHLTRFGYASEHFFQQLLEIDYSWTPIDRTQIRADLDDNVTVHAFPNL